MASTSWLASMDNQALVLLCAWLKEMGRRVMMGTEAGGAEEGLVWVCDLVWIWVAIARVMLYVLPPEREKERVADYKLESSRENRV